MQMYNLKTPMNRGTHFLVVLKDMKISRILILVLFCFFAIGTTFAQSKVRFVGKTYYANGKPYLYVEKFNSNELYTSYTILSLANEPIAVAELEKGTEKHSDTRRYVLRFITTGCTVALPPAGTHMPRYLGDLFMNAKAFDASEFDIKAEQRIFDQMQAKPICPPSQMGS